MDASMFGGNFPWVEPYLESPWVKAMGILAPNFPSPTEANDSEVWRHFFTVSARGSAVLALTGALVAVGVILRSCCCSRRKVETSQPSVKPLMCVGLLTLLLAFAGMCAYLLVGQKGVGLTVDSVGHAISDISIVSQQGEELSTLGAQASAVLNASVPKCTDSAQTYLVSLQQQVESYRGLVGQYNIDMQGIPEHLGNVHTSLDVLSELGMYVLLAPLVLVLLCCLALVIVACATRSFQGSGSCSSGCVRCLGPVLFAPTILIVGLATASEFGFGLATASFCKDADTNSLTYIQHFGGDLAYNVSRYYISGVGTNPLLDQLHEANQTLTKLQAAVEQGGAIVSTQCEDAAPAMENLTATFQSVHAPLNRMDDVLSPANVYPLYKTAIHEDACKTIMSGLAWLMLSQCIVGLVCLPMLTCMTDKFFDRWVWYQSSPAARGLMPPCSPEMVF